ncbi:hypothetical protein GGD63_000911 [Bradyrhizobium sp. cir1]|uniref:hypothetical protein n=1 Tax=Bradyrhizobium sp. cir1 TaxID=1445730 RepID=UPI00179C157C|nr:hypothetical protein [Bradyrhizobium sp. cir1]MBB4368142.1 hypothetical protein [Bradyrhizobium sp. cir1]
MHARDIAIEPSGAPGPAKADAAKLEGVPHLIVWGDFLDKVVWPDAALPGRLRLDVYGAEADSRPEAPG